MPGGHSGEVIPVPIPNTEVKLSYADDTAFWWESRKLPGFFLFILSVTNALYTHRYNQQYLFVSENTLAINHLYSRLFLSAIDCVAKENRFPLSSCETDLCSANSFSLSGVIVSPPSSRAKQFHNRTFPNIFYGRLY